MAACTKGSIIYSDYLVSLVTCPPFTLGRLSFFPCLTTSTTARLSRSGFTFCRFPLLSSASNLMTTCRSLSMPSSTPWEGGLSLLATSITSEKKLTTSICVCVPRSGRSLQNVARNCVAGLKRLPRPTYDEESRPAVHDLAAESMASMRSLRLLLTSIQSRTIQMARPLAIPMTPPARVLRTLSGSMSLEHRPI